MPLKTMAEILRRLLTVGLGAGLSAGLLSGVLHLTTTTPLILEAERYEAAAAHHPPPASLPEREPLGAGRATATVIADMVMGAGFGLLLAAAFALSGRQPSVAGGLGWGMAGFLAIVLAPALGLQPELPGAPAAPLHARQLWWLLTVILSVAGAWLAWFGGRWRWLAVMVIVIPHIVGAPHPPDMGSTVPAELAARFVALSIATSAAFWLMLGALAASIHAVLAGRADHA